MAALAGAVGEHAALQNQRLQGLRHQHRRAGDKTVDHDHTPLRRGLQDRTDQGGNLKTTQSGQGIQGRARIRMALQHGPQHTGLVNHRLSVQPGTRAGALSNIQTGQACQQQRGSGGVANSHFTEQQHITWQALHQLHTLAQRLRALHSAHGGLLRGISRAQVRAIDFAHLQPRALRPGR